MIRYCDLGSVELLDGLGEDTWFRFDLKPGFGEGTLDLRRSDSIALHVKVNESQSTLTLNTFYETWGKEASLSVNIHTDKINLLHISDHKSFVRVTLNNSAPLDYRVGTPITELNRLDNFLGFTRLITVTGALTTGWRQCVKPSGKEASTPVSNRNSQLTPGITTIVRAKNEEQTIFKCLDDMAHLVDRVVSVDNHSSDGTFSRMREAQRQNFNIELYSYDGDVPRVGSEHEAAVRANHASTLGRYYNFCLAKCKTTNFMKWDADFIPIENNLNEMITRYDLRTRTDNFSLWFSGVSVWTDGERFWIDEEAHYNEFRAHSLKHGARWVDLPPWEEIDQSYLFKAQLYAFEKPVFIELFIIDTDEFEERGFCESDSRDRRRFEALSQYSISGSLPTSFTPVESLNSDQIIHRQLTEIDKTNSQYMLMKYNSVPNLHIPETGQEIIRVECQPQHSLGVFCISHKNNAARRQTLRETVKKDFDELGIPFYFVVGSPGRQTFLDGDVLTLNCPDTYEFLSAKIASLTDYFVNHMNLDYMVKIDDDTCVNAITFSQLPYYHYDYFGGGIAGGRNLIFDWHHGKCMNSQLDDVSVIPINGMTWYGGGFGYFLSKNAAAAIAKNSKYMWGQLYEDVAVGSILRKENLVTDELPEPFSTVAHWKTANNPQAIYDSHLVMDIPTCESIRAVYSQLRRVSASHPAADAMQVKTDWWEYTDIADLPEIEENKKTAISTATVNLSVVPEPESDIKSRNFRQSWFSKSA